MAELFGQLGYPTTVADLERRWRDRLAAADIRAIVAEDAGGVIGVLVLHLIAPLHESRKWAMISALVVDEAVRGSGAGALLLSYAEQEALRGGCAHIELSSSESRVRAHQFYLRHGFAEVRKRFVKRYAV